MKPPETLSQKALTVWNEIQSSASRKLNALDYAMIEQLCNEIDIYDKAVREIEETGFTNSYGQVTPAVTIRNQAANTIRQLYKELNNCIENEYKETNFFPMTKNF